MTNQNVPTESSTEFENPYVEDAREWLVFPANGEGDEDTFRREMEISRRSLDSGQSHFDARRDLVYQYAWAVPNEEAIDTIVEYGPVVEIGAGIGYWGHLIQQKGGDWIGYDVDPRTQLNESEQTFRENMDEREGHDQGWLTFEDYCVEPWANTREGDHTAAADHPDRTLFLCWPSYEGTWAADALDAYEGDTVIYVGEGPGGCTGDGEFHDTLYRSGGWRVAESVEIPRWPHIHDDMTVFERTA